MLGSSKFIFSGWIKRFYIVPVLLFTTFCEHTNRDNLILFFDRVFDFFELLNYRVFQRNKLEAKMLEFLSVIYQFTNLLQHLMSIRIYQHWTLEKTLKSIIYSSLNKLGKNITIFAVYLIEFKAQLPFCLVVWT